MRNLTAGNKMNFAIFICIVLIIVFIIVISLSLGLKNQNEKYQITSNACVYDKDYKYIDLEEDAQIRKKWNGSYYLLEEGTKKEYKLGTFGISYEKLRNSLDLFGTFYRIQKGGSVGKTTSHNTINNTQESRFYKIDDRKYLIIAKNIKNNTGSLSTENYLIIILDKLGNALLLNDKINIKTINEMIISTNEFDFDVANEVLRFESEKENINLKKVIGSTNEYVPLKPEEEEKEEKEDKEENEEKDKDIKTADVAANPSGTITTTTTTINNNNSSTIIQNNNNTNNNQNTNTSNTKSNVNKTETKKNNTKEEDEEEEEEDDDDDDNQENINNENNNQNSNKEEIDLGWVDSLNNWINNVASGFQSIYNSSSNNKKEDTGLSKSISLNSVTANVTSLDVNYTVKDPENKYNVVYIIVTGGGKTQTISLDKNQTSYKLTNLEPDTNYTVEIGYKIIYSDAKTEEITQDYMTAKTKAPTEKLEITRVSLDKIYYTLKLDSDFVYDEGCKLVIYLNDTENSSINLTSNMLERAAASGYSSSFTIPEEYKIKESSIKLVLENTKMNGQNITTDLMTKIVNY